MKPITVLLADDHVIMREGLRSLLKPDAAFVIVGEAHDGREAVKQTKQFQPAVVVMDIAMPLLNGLGATRQIMSALPGTKVLILSAHSDDAYIDSALAAGAAGYIIKQTSAQTLAQAIKAVHAGGRFFCPYITGRLREKASGVKKGRSRKTVARLTPRELEVIQLVAEGQGNKGIGASLGISIKTVEKHRQHLMNKLQIHDTAGLTRYAIAKGIIESSRQVTIG